MQTRLASWKGGSALGGAGGVALAGRSRPARHRAMLSGMSDALLSALRSGRLPGAACVAIYADSWEQKPPTIRAALPRWTSCRSAPATSTDCSIRERPSRKGFPSATVDRSCMAQNSLKVS